MTVSSYSRFIYLVLK